MRRVGDEHHDHAQQDDGRERHRVDISHDHPGAGQLHDIDHNELRGHLQHASQDPSPASFELQRVVVDDVHRDVLDSILDAAVDLRVLVDHHDHRDHIDHIEHIDQIDSIDHVDGLQDELGLANELSTAGGGLSGGPAPAPVTCLTRGGLNRIHITEGGFWEGIEGINPSGDPNAMVFVDGPYKNKADADASVASLVGTELAARGGRYVVSASLVSQFGSIVKAVAACLNALGARG